MLETALSRVSNHVYWLSPGKPDRPSLGAVVGSDHTLLLDAGASAAHARLFLDALKVEAIPPPHYAALSHWHWDHIFGAAELNLPLMAHARTAEEIAIMAGYDWSDAALEQRAASGKETRFSADNIKIELPEPRDIRIVRPDIVFQDTLEIHLGGVICRIQHVGGDHAGDSCVMFVEPDQVLFIGDCLCENLHAPVPYFTRKRLFPLLNTLRGFSAELTIEGHNPAVMTQAELEALASQMQLAGELVEQFGADEAAIQSVIEARTGVTWDADIQELVRAFIAGRDYEV